MYHAALIRKVLYILYTILPLHGEGRPEEGRWRSFFSLLETAVFRSLPLAADELIGSPHPVAAISMLLHNLDLVTMGG